MIKKPWRSLMVACIGLLLAGLLLFEGDAAAGPFKLGRKIPRSNAASSGSATTQLQAFPELMAIWPDGAPDLYWCIVFPWDCTVIIET